jgi:hypothetical protein
MRILTLLFLLISCVGIAQSPQQDIDSLSWLSGEWEMEGFKAHYTSPEGGQIFSVSRYFKDGNLTFFEFEQFQMKDGSLHVTPYPKGEKSDSFRLVNSDPNLKKAVFQNPEHDWPQELSYERISNDRLLILVSGSQNGKMRVERFDLKRSQ